MYSPGSLIRACALTCGVRLGTYSYIRACESVYIYWMCESLVRAFSGPLIHRSVSILQSHNRRKDVVDHHKYGWRRYVQCSDPKAPRMGLQYTPCEESLSINEPSAQQQKRHTQDHTYVGNPDSTRACTSLHDVHLTFVHIRQVAVHNPRHAVRRKVFRRSLRMKHEAVKTGSFRSGIMLSNSLSVLQVYLQRENLFGLKSIIRRWIYRIKRWTQSTDLPGLTHILGQCNELSMTTWCIWIFMSRLTGI